jgi:AraC-like DNA-binding protein
MEPANPADNDLPLGRHVLFESRDRDETRQRVSQVFCPHELRVLEPAGRVDARQHYVPLGRAAVSYLSYGTPVAIDPQAPRTFYLVQIPLRGKARIRAGSNDFASSDRIASIINPSDALRMEWSADCGQIIVRFDAAFVELLLTSYLGRPPRCELRFHEVFDCAAGRGRGWLDFVRSVIGLIESEVAAPGPLVTRQLEQTLLAMLLEAQPNNYSEQLAAPRSGYVPRHVRRAEEFIAANLGEPIGIEEIVAASGASMRSLYDGFRRFRGTSPMEFLRTLRLGRVRADLARAGPGTRVSDVAATWGFYQFGRFAAQYRQLYGETPSVTLRRVLSADD